MTSSDFELSGNFADFCNALEATEQPKACSIDNPDCEECGS